MLGLIILAGGKGKRLGAHRPKCMYELAGQPMIDYVLANFASLNPTQTIIVVGYKKQTLIDYLRDKYDFVWQRQLLGTGHAVKMALTKLNNNIRTVLVTNSDDSAFYQKETLKKFLKNHLENNLNFSFLTVKLRKPPQVNKVLGQNGLEPVNPKNKIFQVVCGAYLFKREWLEKNIKKLKKHIEVGEYHLTDLIQIGLDQDKNKVYAFPISSLEWVGVNTKKELEFAERRMMWTKNYGGRP